MGKKIVLGIFGGTVVLGIAVSLAGFIMGGQVGSLNVSDNKMVYRTSKEEISLGKAPSWMGRFEDDFTFMDWGWNSYYGHDYGNSYEYENEEEYDYEGDTIHSADAGGDWDGVTSYSVPSIDSELVNVPLNFESSQLSKIDIDISAGYVTIQPGETLGLTVQGEIPYQANFNNGTWTIKVNENLNGIRSKNGFTSEGPRFYKNGLDVTTEFVLTVPNYSGKLEADLSLGSLQANELSLSHMDVELDLGTMYINNCTVENSEFAVELGTLEVTNFTGNTSSLKASLGTLDFQGAVSDSLSADCELGAIYVTLPRSGNYSWEADTELGTITVDGKTQKGMSQMNGGSGGGNAKLDLDCELGTISVDFAE